jgi:hypothetical protein
MKTIAQRWYPRQHRQQQQPAPQERDEIVAVLSAGGGHLLMVRAKPGAAGSASGRTLAQRLYPRNPSATR